MSCAERLAWWERGVCISIPDLPLVCFLTAAETQTPVTLIPQPTFAQVMAPANSASHRIPSLPWAHCALSFPQEKLSLPCPGYARRCLLSGAVSTFTAPNRVSCPFCCCPLVTFHQSVYHQALFTCVTVPCQHRRADLVTVLRVPMAAPGRRSRLNIR